MSSPATIEAGVLRELDRSPTVLVIIEIRAAVQPDPDAGLAGLSSQVADLHEGILGELDKLGVTDARSLVLANAISAVLTREQVLAVAGRDDVRRISLSRPEQVTA